MGRGTAKFTRTRASNTLRHFGELVARLVTRCVLSTAPSGRALAAGVLIGPTLAQAIAIAFVGRLQSLGYSRDVESRADITGSDICAGAVYNSGGLVWLFEDFKSAKIGETPELLSDYPNDEHRVQALKTHFQDNPAVVGKYNPKPRSVTPIILPKNEDENFLRWVAPARSHVCTSGGAPSLRGAGGLAKNRDWPRLKMTAPDLYQSSAEGNAERLTATRQLRTNALVMYEPR